MSDNQKYWWCFFTCMFGAITAEAFSSGPYDYTQVIVSIYWIGATLFVHKFIWSKS